MLRQGDIAPDFEAENARAEKFRLRDMLQKGPVAVVFLRYIGCPICRLRIGEMARDDRKLEEMNLQLLIVVESDAEHVERYLSSKDIRLNVIPDPRRELYDLFDVRPGSIGGYLSPSTLATSVKAVLQGHMHGAFEGDEFQFPAAFVIGTDGILKYAVYGRNPADSASAEELIGSLKD